jgi:hypothetical protein
VLNQSVAVWQLHIMFLRVMGPTSSSRNTQRPKGPKAIAFEKFILNCHCQETFSGKNRLEIPGERCISSLSY